MSDEFKTSAGEIRIVELTPSLRDWFAMHAMRAFLSGLDLDISEEQETLVARKSYDVAAAMLRDRENWDFSEDDAEEPEAVK